MNLTCGCCKQVKEVSPEWDFIEDDLSCNECVESEKQGVAE